MQSIIFYLTWINLLTMKVALLKDKKGFTKLVHMDNIPYEILLPQGQNVVFYDKKLHNFVSSENSKKNHLRFIKKGKIDTDLYYYKEIK